MVNDCILLQTKEDWNLQRMYINKFKNLVLVKSIHHNSAEKRARLQYEFSLFANEQNPWLLKPIAIDYIDNQYAIIYENFNGVPLHEFRNKHISLHQFLQIALELVNACIKMQQSDLLYLNLNPSQILINPNSLKVKLLSSEFSLKYDAESPVILENLYERLEQLPYYAPEQTGRVNLEIDHRSDLYALGIIFYEILSGQLPFQKKDSVELIYEILTKVPNSLVNLQPYPHPIIWNIIEKLLAKNPELRYQSAVGLREDLLQIQHKLLIDEPLHDFHLGEYDIHLNAVLSTKYYGRKHQIMDLSSMFHQVVNGEKKIVMISGKAGSGKSKLVYTLKGDIAAAKGYFVETKYEQLQLENDFTAVVQPLRNLLKIVYLEGENSVQALRKLFHDVKLMVTDRLVHLLPELRWFFKEAAGFRTDVRENAKQLHTYIFSSLQKILLAFAMQKKPIVWLMDDLQWANASTLEMMTQLYEQHRAGYLMWITTFRSNEEGDLKKNYKCLNNFPSNQHIEINPLEEDDVRLWLEESLHAKSTTIKLISTQLFRLTKGNPLFVKEAFRSLQQSNTIYFNTETKEWQFSIHKYNQSFFNNELLTFIENRMATLDKDAQGILRIVSCFGQSFEFSSLLKLVSISAQDLLKLLGTLVEHGFIVPMDAHFKWASKFEHEGILHTFHMKFQFVHDRIQQVAYQDLSDEERTRLHYQIGKLLTKNIPNIVDSYHLSEVVKHFNYGQQLLNADEKQNLAIWNYKLGIAAKRIGLFDSAISFLTTSIELLPDNHWQSFREMSVKIYANLGECAYLVGRYDVSEFHLTEALRHSKTVLEKLLIYNLKTLLYIESDNHTVGIEAGIKGLQITNMNIAENPSKIQLLKEYLLLRKALHNKSDIDLLKYPPIQDKEMDTLIHLIINMTASTFMLNPNLTGILLMRGLRLQLKYGNGTKSGVVYINYAMLLNAGFNNIQDSARFGKIAITFAENENNIYIKGRIYFVYGIFINHWTNPYESSLQYIQKAQHNSQEIGLHHLVSAASCFIVAIQFINGTPIQDLQQEIERQQQEFSIHASALSIDFLAEMGLWMNVLQNPNSPIDWAYPFAILDQPIIKMMHYSIRLKMSFLLGDDQHGKEFMEILKVIEKEIYTLPITPIYYFYRALWQFHFIHQKLYSSKTELRTYRMEISKSIRQFKKWAQYAPENYEHLYCLLMAENFRMKKQGENAILYYDRAIQLAQMNNFLQDAAISYERAANYYHAINHKKTARHYILCGIQIIKEWGANTVASHWEKVYHANHVPKGQHIGTVSFDMMTVFETTQSLATEIRMEDLLRKILFALLKHAGADVGYFIHRHHEQLQVLAQAEANETKFTIFHDHKIEEFSETMQSIVYFVLQSGEQLIIQNTQAQSVYLSAFSTAKSILCVPIHLKDEIIAILYLENTLITNAFHPTHVNLLKMISGQIAVSIENAKIYGELEKRVLSRTKELDETNSHLKKVNERLEKNELERKKLLHSISHELRSPITSTLGYIELILDGVIKEESEQEKYLIRSKERLLSLNVLIQDLFDLANLEAGRAEYTFIEVRAINLFQQFRFRFEREIKQLGLDYYADFYGHQEAQLLIDRARINQVIENLMTNAMKYTSNGSIQFLMYVEDTHLICSISDSGIGIPQSDIPFIFDSYYRASNVDKVDSHGIGLAICKQIVEQHNGEIYVESIEGEGSIFSFTLPLVIEKIKC